MTRKKNRFKKILLFIRNKYTITFLVLVSWLIFFDKNDIVSQISLSKKFQQLNDEKQYYLTEIAQTKSDMKELMTNPKNLEKFAREKYLMKKDDEDIFVIVEKKIADTPANSSQAN